MENAYLIQGGKKLQGEIKLSGAKNVALKTIIAGLMFNRPVLISNVPRINDVFELIHLIEDLGGKANFVEENTILIDGKSLSKNKVDFLHASKIRVSFMLFAPLLYKFGECYIPNPGGCRIGARPIDRIIEGFRNLGIKVEYNSETGYYFAKLNKKPNGFYRFSKPTHTGSEALILMSLFTDSQVVLENCALEPEIDDLINFLNLSGAKIKREKDKIYIFSAKSLSLDYPYQIINDRNELVTYTCMVLATKGEAKIGEINPLLITSFIKALKKANVQVEIIKKNFIKVKFNKRLKATKITTSPYPGFMTDWQPNWAILMTQATGQSIIIERVFENRFAYVEELKKLGCQIDFLNFMPKNPKEYFFFNYQEGKKYLQAIKIVGPQKLHNGVVNITDLRAGATLAIAALVAEGESVVNGANILERGYENFVGKVRQIGGKIKKI